MTSERALHEQDVPVGAARTGVHSAGIDDFQGVPVHLALLLIHPGRPAGYPVRQDRFSLAYRLVIERSFA